MSISSRRLERANLDVEQSDSRCPCSAGETSNQCTARWGNVRASFKETSLYCFGPEHVLCVVFNRFKKTGRPLTQWEYLVEKLKEEREGLHRREPLLPVSFES